MAKTLTELMVVSKSNTLSKELKRPTGFNVMLFLFMLGVIADLLLVEPNIPTFIFGKLIYGTAGSFIGLLFVIIGLSLAYGFYRLKKIAWTLGIPWLLFEAINELFSLTSIAPRENSLLLLIAIISLITSIPVILYLNSKKKYFIC